MKVKNWTEPDWGKFLADAKVVLKGRPHMVKRDLLILLQQEWR